MTKPNDWRILTPVIVSLSPILLGIIGWFLLDNLNTIRKNIEQQTIRIEMITEKLNNHTVHTEGRFSKVETEIKNIDSRLDRVEYNRRIVKNGS